MERQGSKGTTSEEHEILIRDAAKLISTLGKSKNENLIGNQYFMFL